MAQVADGAVVPCVLLREDLGQRRDRCNDNGVDDVGVVETDG